MYLVVFLIDIKQNCKNDYKFYRLQFIMEKLPFGRKIKILLSWSG